jgi:GntR family transcriptional regulator
MFNNIDPRSPTPIYAQIAISVRIAVGSGELTPGESLPSVRALAMKLRVNPATVVQAYRELEREGIVEMRQGAGTFVAQVSLETRSREKTTTARRFVQQMFSEAARLGLSPAELREALDTELDGNKKPESQ